MNGRVYLPEIGRFLSPDPFVQFPESTQNYNRYVYVGNNPLSYTDPSGHFIFALAAAVASSYVSTQTAIILSAVAGYLETGSIKGAALFAASAGMAAGVNSAFKAAYGEVASMTGTQLLMRAITHGVTQGAISAAGGGRFGDGALGGFVGSYLGGHFERSGGTGSKIGNIIVLAIIGGTASKAAGGKFANGAMSAAFTAALAPTGQRLAGGGPDSNGEVDPETVAALRAKILELVADGTLVSHGYDSPEAAATAVLDIVAPLSREYGLELGGNINHRNGKYYFTVPTIGGPSSVPVGIDSIGYHTHPSGSLLFSNDLYNAGTGNDTAWVRASGKDLYLGVQRPSGAVGIAVCEPLACGSHPDQRTHFRGAPGRVIRP